MSFKKAIKKYVRRGLWQLHALSYRRFYATIKKINGLAKIDEPGKEEWKQRWEGLGIKPDGFYYDVFGHYMRDRLDIVPENICHDIIEPILNPILYQGYYSDKNLFDKIMSPGVMPVTIIRKMGGFWMDAEYRPLTIDNDSFLKRLNESGYNRIVIKPAVCSCSGDNVNIVERRDGKWRVLEGDYEFNLKYVEENYGSDLIIQEALVQLPELARFNPTSVNTLRLTLYRSVITDKWDVCSGVIRIGGKGAFKDNAHQGGGYALLNLDGTLGHRVYNQWGQSVSTFNDVDFAGSTFKIPEFEKIIDFAKSIGKNIYQQRLLALDIMINAEGQPKLIEFNLDGFGMWVFQYAGKGAFGKYTQEIIDYCRCHLNEARQTIRI